MASFCLVFISVYIHFMTTVIRMMNIFYNGAHSLYRTTHNLYNVNNQLSVYMCINMSEAAHPAVTDCDCPIS